MTIFQEKKIFRSKMRLMLKEKYSGSEQRAISSSAVCRKVSCLREFTEAQLLFSYIAYGDELDTSSLIQAAFLSGKQVCVPRVADDGKSMDFFYLEPDAPLKSQLESGSYGILEPKLSLAKAETDSSLNGKKILMTVPGLAFTEGGKRLGKGKGFYDIYIPRLIRSGCSLFTCGLGYAEQIVQNLPCESTDFVLDKVISP